MIKVSPWLVVSALVFLGGCGSSGGTGSTTAGVKSASASPDPTTTAPGGLAGATVPAGTSEVAVSTNQTPQDLAAQADVPVYPGAAFPDKMTQAPKKDEAGKMHTYLVMSTSDKPAKVIAFYLKGGKYSEMKTKDGSQVQGLSPKGNLVLIDVTVQGGQTIIGVKSVQGT